MDREVKKKNALDELNESWQTYMKKRMKDRVLSPVAETYSISEKQKKQLEEWKAKLPKRLSKMDYEEWIMFSGKSGIGLSIKVRREYRNGVIREIDITDVSEW